MKINFASYKNIKEIDSSVLVMFLSEEYIKNFIKVNGLCTCGNDCKCGDNCKCDKCPIQQSVYDYDFKGKFLEIASVGSKAKNFNKVILIGLGKEKELDSVKAEQIGYKAFKYLNSNKVKNATFLFNTTIEKDGEIKYEKENFYSNLVFGFSMAEYNFNKYFTDDKKKENKFTQAIFVANDVKTLQKQHKENEIIKENVFFCRDLINEPSNTIYPESYAKMCKELEKLGVEVEILKEKDMQKLGMGSLLAVGQGSDNESLMVILKYTGNKKSKDQPLAFIGKGITFDSGGLSLKPSSAMDTMKCDMSGSAVVISLIRLLAQRKAKVNAIGIMPLVENMPSGKAVKVGDIVKSMSGQTIEVLNTDAEGRMILADAIYYAVSKFDPKIVIDLATLTGAICIALGEKYAGLFTNNDELSKELTKAGEATGETLWRMPLSPLGGFYDRLIDSEFADVRNTGKTRDGGSITAAQFLQRFTNKHKKWAHIDIAATAYLNQEGFLTQKNASGYGVRLLNKLIEDNYEK